MIECDELPVFKDVMISFAFFRDPKELLLNVLLVLLDNLPKCFESRLLCSMFIVKAILGGLWKQLESMSIGYIRMPASVLMLL